MGKIVLLLLALVTVNGHAFWAQNGSGTTRYYVAFLRPDPQRRSLTSDEGERIQRAHMANIHKMADDGVLVSAGPFDDTPHTISGIFIFKVESLERAKEIAMKDPTVLAHRNTIEVHAWDGPTGIGEEYVRLHGVDPKMPESMQMHPFCILMRGRAGAAENELSRTHLRYIQKLKADGALSAAGRMDGDSEMVGLVIFRAMPLEKAKRLMSEDPSVKGGLFNVEYHQWWSADHVLTW
jgi:uncharacterized protein YciI